MLSLSDIPFHWHSEILSQIWQSNRAKKAKLSLKLSLKLYEKGIVPLVFLAYEVDAPEKRAKRG